jgi:hypothetical protein
MTLQCTQNPAGGPYIGNSVVTGIRLTGCSRRRVRHRRPRASWPSLGRLCRADPDEQFRRLRGVPRLPESTASRAGWVHGYPVQLWVEGTAAPAFVKQLSRS